MNPFHVASTSSPPPVAKPLPAKRKRGRPRKDASMPQGESSRVTTPKEDVNLVGKTISGVVEGSFEAGFIINVKVKDSDTRLRGLVFARGKVVPVTPENDVAPHVKMIVREKIKNQTDDRYQSCPPNVQTMKDAVADSELSECARALILLPHGINEEDPEELMEEREAANRLVEFFQTSETTLVTAGQQNLALARKETNEKHKSPGEARGFDLMAEEPVHPVDEVPQELQLGLGNKTILSGDNSSNGTAMEIDLKSSMSRNGFIAKLLKGKEKVDC